MRGSCGRTIAHPLGQQGNGLARYQVTDALGCSSTALTIDQDQRKPPMCSLDHLQGVAARTGSVLANLGYTNLQFEFDVIALLLHGLIIIPTVFLCSKEPLGATWLFSCLNGHTFPLET